MLRILFLLIVSFSFAQQKTVVREVVPLKGLASYYGIWFQGKLTANGEPYNRLLFTAAHRRLPFNTYVRVTNLKNQMSITIRVNDRGPYNYSRIIDLSEAAARRIGSYQHGLTTVQLEILNLIRLTPEIDSIFTSNDVLDCLGNEDQLGNHSIDVYRTKDLIHVIYLANELYLHEDVDKVYIVGKGSGIKRIYSIVISNYNTKEECLKAKNYFEKKGFMEVSIMKR